MHGALLFLSMGVMAAGAALPAFRVQVIDAKIGIGYGLATGDVDGDGKKDVLLADAREIVWYRNPGWEKTIIARELTPRDHVCIAARDIDGDGRVEIAVGAQWNPGETGNEKESGAVIFLLRPASGEGTWTPVILPHDVTVHRMHWVQEGVGKFALAVLPLHGKGNAAGAGANTVRLQLSRPPANWADATAWKTSWLDTGMHITHNFDQRPGPVAGSEELIIGGREGLALARPDGHGWALEKVTLTDAGQSPAFSGTGEIRFGQADTLSAIEPFHGTALTVYEKSAVTRCWERTVIDNSFNQGHALSWASFPGLAAPAIVAGWREPDPAGRFGIRIYTRKESGWDKAWLAGENTMACEDLRAEDLDGDGTPEIIASGRATKNVVIYWSQPAK